MGVFGPDYVRNARKEICQKAATIANEEMRDYFLGKAGEQTQFGQRLAVMRKQSPAQYNALAMGWKPFTSDSDGPTGFGLKLSEATSMLLSDFIGSDFLTDIVRRAIQQAAMENADRFIRPMLTDMLEPNDDSYYEKSMEKEAEQYSSPYTETPMAFDPHAGVFVRSIAADADSAQSNE